MLVPDGRYHFTLPSGESFSLDPIESLKAIDDIARRCEGKTDYSHLDEFVTYVKQDAGIILTRTQADWLMDTLRSEYAREKKERLATLLWQPSTESIPSDCPLDN